LRGKISGLCGTLQFVTQEIATLAIGHDGEAASKNVENEASVAVGNDGSPGFSASPF
jgi:hypothetical protein